MIKLITYILLNALIKKYIDIFLYHKFVYLHITGFLRNALSYTCLKHYPKKGSISFHRLPQTPFHGVEKLNEKILGSPSNIQGQLRLLPHVRQRTECTGQVGTKPALVFSDLLFCPIPEQSLQCHNPRVFFELISKERSSRNQCQGPAGGAAPSPGGAFWRPDTHRAQATSFHTSTPHSTPLHTVPPHCIPCHRP